MFSWYCKDNKCRSRESCARNIIHYPRMIYGDFFEPEKRVYFKKCSDYAKKDDENGQ
jgi:hypothetical protein